MSLVAMEIPDDPSDWPKWLERELVGVRLGDLVGELRVLAGKNPGASPPLNQLLGERRSAVCEQGLSVLGREQLVEFLKYPERLLDLQELVFTSGGQHWRNLESACKSNEATQRVWQGIQGQLRSAAISPSNEFPTGSANRNRRTLISGAIGSVVVLAASLMIAAWMGVFSPSSEKWGWFKEDTFAAQLKDKDYLNLLADRAGEWTTRPRSTQAELRSSLADFRRMCDLLQSSSLSQLSNQSDRDWVKERCGAWAEKIDGHLADLGAGEKSVETVLGDANSTIESLQEALRKRAAELGA